MVKAYYWKVLDSRGRILHTSSRSLDRSIGRSLRRQYPASMGFSVRRVTVRAKARTAPAQLGLFARLRLAFGL